MNLKLVPFAAIAAIMATSCSKEEVMDINYDPDGKAITFTAGVGHSRAVETTVKNLGDFNVIAKGIHPHGGIYDNYMIGSSTAGEKATRSSLNADSEGGIWKLDHNVSWPVATTSALFWAYTFSQLQSDNTKTDVMPTGVTLAFNTEGTTPSISGFKPVKADLSAASNAGFWNDGEKQSDFLIAFTQQDRKNGTSVKLNFDHALCQVDIKAKSANKADNDDRIVKIKGAWIVNTKNTGSISAGYTWDEDNKKADTDPKWTATIATGDFSAYGSFYSTPILLATKDAVKNLLGSTLMIIPQTNTAWDKTAGDTEGTYILLLCRVELEHPGTAHTGTGSDADDTTLDDVKIQNGKHYHQQFPVNANSKFEAGEYGFVCVPVSTDWEMGKRYVYTLDICGAATGAGSYPLDLPDKFAKLVPANHKYTTFFGEEATLKIVPRGDIKGVGEPVLDAAIQFEVSVESWADAGRDWTNGNVNLQ